MSKIVLDTISSGYNLSKINANFVLLQNELNNSVLYRVNPTGEPNSLSDDIDLNGNDILNGQVAHFTAVQIGGVSVVPGSTLTVPTAASVPNVPAGNISSTDVQAAINELDVTLTADEVDIATNTANISTNAANIVANTVAISETAGRRGALVYNNASQDIVGTTVLLFDQETYDTSSIHDTVTNNERLTVPSGVSKIRLSAGVDLISTIADGTARIYFKKNTGDVFKGNSFTAPSHYFSSIPANLYIYLNWTSPIIEVIAGDYFSIEVIETSTGTVRVGYPWFSMEIVE